VYEAAGKVFLGDVEVTVGPAVSDLLEVGEEHVADDCGRGRAREELLEGLLGGRLVVALERPLHLHAGCRELIGRGRGGGA
jgi:hypothetical protein